MLITKLLVALLTVAVQAAPTNNSDSEIPPKEISYEVFKAMTLEERLGHYSEYKIYRPDRTLNCLKECIEKTPGYDIHNATYGQMCKNDETMKSFNTWIETDVGRCIQKQREAEKTAEVEAGLRDQEMDETACSIAFAYYDERTFDICNYIWQNATEVSEYQPPDNWNI